MNRKAGETVVAPLGPRLGAALLDRLVPGVIIGLWCWLMWGIRLDGWLIYGVGCAALLFGWVLAQWWLYATRKAGLGYRLFGLELVGLADGRPIGWGRMALRTLILFVLWVTLLPGIAMLVFLVVQERRMGWHDLAVRSVAVARRPLPAPPPRVAQPNARPAPSTVGLPPHLLSGGGFAAPLDDPPPIAPIERIPTFGAATAAPGGRPEPVGAGHQQPQPSWTAAPTDPAPPVRIRRREVPSEDSDRTRLVASQAGGPRVAGQGWHIRLDDGREIAVPGLLLLGRSPVARPDEQSAILVSAGEPGQTVSKTHLALTVDQQGLSVIDRGSTNGTALLSANGAFEPCPADVEVRLRAGQVVSFGERQFQVLQH